MQREGARPRYLKVERANDEVWERRGERMKDGKRQGNSSGEMEFSYLGTPASS